MIPDYVQVHELWERYGLPEKKQIHCQRVADLSVWFAKKYRHIGVRVNTQLLSAAALLHDIDKAVAPAFGERHPDTGVRLLRESGMAEVADVVETHSLGSILFPDTAPRTIEQKILYLSDKMVKQEIIGVDERFRLWRKEHIPNEAARQLLQAFPLVKKLEHEVCADLGIRPADLLSLAQSGK